MSVQYGLAATALLITSQACASRVAVRTGEPVRLSIESYKVAYRDDVVIARVGDTAVTRPVVHTSHTSTWDYRQGTRAINEISYFAFAGDEHIVERIRRAESRGQRYLLAGAAVGLVGLAGGLLEFSAHPVAERAGRVSLGLILPMGAVLTSIGLWIWSDAKSVTLDEARRAGRAAGFAIEESWPNR